MHGLLRKSRTHREVGAESHESPARKTAGLPKDGSFRRYRFFSARRRRREVRGGGENDFPSEGLASGACGLIVSGLYNFQPRSLERG